MKLLCRLFGHRWQVRQPISFIPFDQGGVACRGCGKSYGVNHPEALLIARGNNL